MLHLTHYKQISKYLFWGLGQGLRVSIDKVSEVSKIHKLYILSFELVTYFLNIFFIGKKYFWAPP